MATGAAQCAASAETERRQSGVKRSDAADHGMFAKRAFFLLPLVCLVRPSFQPVFEIRSGQTVRQTLMRKTSDSAALLLTPPSGLQDPTTHLKKF